MSTLASAPGCATRALCASLLLAPLFAVAADLQVVVTHAPDGPAVLYAALYDSAAAYDGDKAVATQMLPMRGGDVRLAFLGLPAGSYALKVFADANGNGKLDTNLLGLPTERYGFSKDATGQRSAPGFDAAALRLDDGASVTTTIHLR